MISKNSFPSLILLFFFLIGFAFRFWQLGMTDLTSDEGHYSYDAFQFYKSNLGMVPRYHPKAHVYPNMGHPFLAQFLAYLSYKIFNPSIFSARFFSALSSVLTIPIIYLIGKIIFDNSTALIAAGMFSVFPLSVYYGRTAYLDSLLTFLLSLFLLSYLYFIKTKNFLSAIFVGLISALICLTKLDGPLIGIFLIIDLILWKNFKEIVKNLKFYFAILISFVIVFVIGVSPLAYIAGILDPSDPNFLHNIIFTDIKVVCETFINKSFASLIPYIFIFLVILGIRKYLQEKRPAHLIILFICWLPLVWGHMTAKSGIYGLLPLVFIANFFAAFYLGKIKYFASKKILLAVFLWFIFASIKWGLITALAVSPIDSDALLYLRNLNLSWEEKVYLFERPHSYFFQEEHINFLVNPGLMGDVVKMNDVSLVVSTDKIPEGRLVNEALIKSGDYLLEKKFENKERNLMIFSKKKE